MIIKNISLHVEVYTPNDKCWLTIVFLTPEGREHKINIYDDVIVTCFIHNPTAVINNLKKNKDRWVEVFVDFPYKVRMDNSIVTGAYVLCQKANDDTWLNGWDPETRKRMLYNKYNIK